MKDNNQNIFTRRDEREEKIRKIVIDQLNKIDTKEIYKNYSKKITTIGIA